MDRHEWIDTDAVNDSQIGQLLKLSGRRRRPANAQVARARVAARAEWERAVRIRADHQVREAGLPLQTGDRVTSHDSRAAMLFADGIALRLDRETTITLDAARVTLLRGAAYVDAGPEPRGSGLVVETPLGTIRHVGTQFEVRLLRDALRVRVREGAVVVVVERESGRWTLGAGEALLIAPDKSAKRQPTATSGPDWNWVSELAQPFQLEGSTLRSFLEWTAREEGWKWEFESAALQRRVERIVLRGSIEGLTPEEAVLAVLPACGLVARRSGDRLIVSAARSAS